MSRNVIPRSSNDSHMFSGDRWLESVADELQANAHPKRQRHEAPHDGHGLDIKRKEGSSDKKYEEDYGDRHTLNSMRVVPSNKSARKRNWSPESRSVQPSRASNEHDDDEGEWVEVPALSTQTTSPSPNESKAREFKVSTIPPSSKPKKGPTLPSIADMQLMNSELQAESLEAMRSVRISSKRQAEAEYVGAAENLLSGGVNDPSGPRDRKIEKRQLENQTRREYVRARSPGGVDEVGDDELLDGAIGGGSSGKLSEIAARKAEKERIKKEKREAFYRERDAERRKRWEEMQAREKKTIDMLKELARHRFGDVP
ncbi:hypothetical protein V1509DRAFT_631253 [Lipomyces kononenkoae]